MDVTWYVCDLLTGQFLEELPLDAGGGITRRIAFATSQTLNLPTADENCPSDWVDKLVPGKSMCVLTLDHEPVQGWAVEEFKFGATVVPVTCSTLETMAARTNVPTYPAEDDFTTDLSNTDLSEVAAQIAAPLVDRFGVIIEWTPCGTTNPDLTPYDSTVDQSILAALTDLNAATNGPEWRLIVRWVDPTVRREFEKVLQIGPRIGEDRPDAIFDLDSGGRGNIESYERTVSFAAGKGATMVIGTSDGSGASRPMTEPLVSDRVAQGWPVWEERVNFSGLDASDIDDPDAALLSRAKATLAQRERGGVVWVLTVDENAPIPGRDYNEGDTVHLAVAPQGNADPVGGTMATRVAGWTVDPATGRSNPVLWETDDTDTSGS
jgi:hypothetical protein